MKNINLKSEDLSQKKLMKSSSSNVLSVIIIVLVSAIFGAIFGINFYMEKQIAQIKSEINSIENEFQGEEYLELYAFNRNLINLKNNISRQGFLPQTRGIIEISKNTLPLIKFSSLKVSEQESHSNYEVTLNGPDYDYLVKQFRAYKGMQDVNNFLLKSIVDEDGKLVAIINFSLGKALVAGNKVESAPVESF